MCWWMQLLLIPIVFLALIAMFVINGLIWTFLIWILEQIPFVGKYIKKIFDKAVDMQAQSFKMPNPWKKGKRWK